MSETGSPAAPTVGKPDARLSRLSDWTRRLLLLQILVVSVGFVSGVLEHQLLSDFHDGIYTSQAAAMEAAETNDGRQRVIGIAEIIIAVAAGIVILMWVYRANANARRIGAADMRFTPGWAVAWYFIPIFNLWRPYQAMKEIWQASADPAAWQSQPVPSLIGWWWAGWLIANALGNATFRLASKAEDIDGLLEVNTVSLASNLAFGAVSFVLLAIVRKVSDMQAAHGPHPAT